MNSYSKGVVGIFSKCFIRKISKLTGNCSVSVFMITRDLTKSIIWVVKYYVIKQHQEILWHNMRLEGCAPFRIP